MVSERRKTPAAAAALVALNIWIAWPLFGAGYTVNFSSIEGFFVAIARHLSTHWGDASWWPMWHGGMPFQDTYVPLVHVASAALASLFTPVRAYHCVVALAYCFGPATRSEEHTSELQSRFGISYA